MTPLTWKDNGTQPGVLFMAYSRRHYVGYVTSVDPNSVSEDPHRWCWGFRDAGRWVRGECRRKSDAKRRVVANWQRFCVDAGFVDAG